MSLERVIEALVTLGLSRLDSEIYVYITKKISTTIFDLGLALNYPKNQITSSMERLIAKGLVTKEGITFSALPFEEALDLLIRTEKQIAESLQESEKKLLISWEKKD